MFDRSSCLTLGWQHLVKKKTHKHIFVIAWTKSCIFSNLILYERFRFLLDFHTRTSFNQDKMSTWRFLVSPLQPFLLCCYSVLQKCDSELINKMIRVTSAWAYFSVNMPSAKKLVTIITFNSLLCWNPKYISPFGW